MASSLEDILINVNNVKKNKCEGSLFLMTRRLAWMPAGKNNFTVSYDYSDIKLQKISPDSKEKVQLQVVLEAGGASTFHFNNPGGRQAQMKDRESVKSLLQDMINKFKKNVNTELELKSQFLVEHPSMFELYKFLVVSGKLTSDEFWASRINQIKPNKVPEQETGVSSGFLGEIQGHADGCNGIKYNLTPDIISSIFKTYPAVQRKHTALVPNCISEQQFWYEFFQSHYFHRDRTNISEKEVFGDCAQIDEQALRQEMEKRWNNKEGQFGALYDNILQENLNADDDDVTATSASASLIKRFNQHSTMVLKSTLANNSNNNNNNDDNNNNNNNKNNKNGVIEDEASGLKSSNSSDIKKTKNKNDKRKLSDASDASLHTSKKRHKHTTEAQEVYSMGDDDGDSNACQLKLSKTEAYLHGPIPRDCLTYNTSDELFSASQAFKNAVASWKATPVKQLLTSSSALAVLSELSPSGSLMQTSSSSLNVAVLTSDLQGDFRLLQLTLIELLRHFWECFPVTDKSLESKIVRMEGCLREFEKSQLQAFIDKLNENHLQVNETTGNIKNMLEKAYTKFSSWMSRKSNRRT